MWEIQPQKCSPKFTTGQSGNQLPPALQYRPKSMAYHSIHRRYDRTDNG